MYQAIIEIPKNDIIRRHLKNDKSGFIELGPIKDKIPVNNGVCPYSYGFIPNTYNDSDQDEIDIIVISPNTHQISQQINVNPIALLVRDDGDHKVLAVEENETKIQSWQDLSPDQQELIKSFFSYCHESIIKDANEASNYINSNKAKNSIAYPTLS
jgi:inorganic pyrophosphatase